ncbi:MAG: DUF1569 domain-containing protein [Acidimicrobiia bacterium]|nr:DUF1569 domain-containing protein [Acidimicrobiia bacterium]
MPRLLHEHAASVRARIEALTSTATPTWGRMSGDQMLHHVNIVLAEALGEHTAAKNIKGLPEPLVRWAIINIPWSKGAPTRPDMLIPEGQHYDFAAEKQRCLSMFDRFVAKGLTEPWPRAANFAMTGKHWSQLQFKHLNHHLEQFGL